MMKISRCLSWKKKRTTKNLRNTYNKNRKSLRSWIKKEARQFKKKDMEGSHRDRIHTMQNLINHLSQLRHGRVANQIEVGKIKVSEKNLDKSKIANIMTMNTMMKITEKSMIVRYLLAISHNNKDLRSNETKRKLNTDNLFLMRNVHFLERHLCFKYLTLLLNFKYAFVHLSFCLHNLTNNFENLRFNLNKIIMKIYFYLLLLLCNYFFYILFSFFEQNWFISYISLEISLIRFKVIY